MEILNRTKIYMYLNKNLKRGSEMISEKRSKHNKFLTLLLIILLPLSLFIVLINLFQVISIYCETFGVIERPILELLIVFLLLVAVLLSLAIILSVKQYHNRIMIRRTLLYGNHPNLKLKEIFDNEHRKKIIRTILNDPGIHHNAILRTCNLKKGQLQWHLNVLLDYNIIRKEKLGQYTIYFPLLKVIENMENMIKGLTKSEMTTQILQLIEEYPGIISSEISNKIGIARNSVKYHIDKLIRNNLISFKRSGRKKMLYVDN